MLQFGMELTVLDALWELISISQVATVFPAPQDLFLTPAFSSVYALPDLLIFRTELV